MWPKKELRYGFWPQKKNKKIGAVKKGGGTAATAENKHPTEFCYF